MMAKKESIPNLYIRFYHPQISNLSDRTLKTLLREFSKICRQALTSEIDLMLKDFELPYRIQQSVRDRARRKMSGEASFYVDRIDKGSIELMVVLSAVSIWALKETIGESFKRAFKESDMGKDVDELLVKALNKMVGYMKKRPKVMSEKVMPSFKDKQLAGRFLVSEIKTKRSREKRVVFITIKTIENVEVERGDIKMDNQEVLDHLVRNIRSIQRDLAINKAKESSKAKRTKTE